MENSNTGVSGVMTIRPVGIIRNKVAEPFLVSGEKGLTRRKGPDTSMAEIHKNTEDISEIIIDGKLDGILDGIDEYSHITVIYWAHGVPEEGRSLTKVHPMGRKDYPLVGLFGTCSPARPNPVLTTVVRLLERKENILKVTGLDAIDGSPVVDIKPYVRDFCPHEKLRIPAWMQQIIEEVDKNR